MNALKSVAGKVAIVTGAKHGIGKGIAKALAQAGYGAVVCADVDKIGADVVAKELQGMNIKSMGVKCDVSVKADVTELVKKTMDTYGKLDVMVRSLVETLSVKIHVDICFLSCLNSVLR